MRRCSHLRRLRAARRWHLQPLQPPRMLACWTAPLGWRWKHFLEAVAVAEAKPEQAAAWAAVRSLKARSLEVAEEAACCQGQDVEAEGETAAADSAAEGLAAEELAAAG